MLSLNVVLLIPIGMFWMLRRFRISKTTLIGSSVFFLILLLSFGVAQLGPCEDKFSKAFITAPLLTILLMIGLEVGARAKPEEWQKLRSTAFRVLIVAFFFVIAEILFPQFFSINKIKYHTELKYSGIFNEPSHVAISLFPCIVLLLSSNDKTYNRKGIYSLLLLFLLSRSSTLVMLTFCYIAYRLVLLRKLKQSLKYLSIIAVVIAIAVTFNYELLVAPTVERADDVTALIADNAGPSNKNLSSMVYYKGWQDALTNTARTYGLGLGFNMMGCTPLPDTPLRRIFSAPDRTELNIEDGSFLLSKLMSEFGLPGLVFFLLVIFYWIRYEVNTKALPGSEQGDTSTIHSVFMFSFVVTSLLRSTGYFQGGFLLWVSAAVGATVLIKKHKLSKRAASNTQMPLNDSK